jgi:ubiquinone/menaquinone biosynthesis C-methylase UbiE
MLALLRRQYAALQKLLVPGLRHPQYHYLEVVLRELSPGIRWLDLGCGHQILPWAMDLDEKTIVSRCGIAVGLDVDADNLKKHASIANRVIGSGEQLPFGPGVFDIVTANTVVEHLTAPGAVLAEVRRVLRPGGQFVFITPNLNSPYMRVAAHTPDGVKRMLARVFEGRAENDVFPTTYRMNTEVSIRAAAEYSGFRVIRLEHRNSTAITARLGPLAIPELLFIRALRSNRLKKFRINLLVALEKI